MATGNIDLLAIQRGLVIAPAGCGKTQLITDALRRYNGTKPILILTHTNAGVAALRNRLDKAGVPASRYRLSTIDGWAIRLITTFPQTAAHDPSIVENPNYPKIRAAAAKLLKGRHVNDILAASYARLLVDEYQDCSLAQHAIVYYAAAALPTCVLGDEMQAIFGFGDDRLADWDEHVCKHFPLAGELDQPWRWINAGTKELGDWLLEARRVLKSGGSIDLRKAPAHVEWLKLDGTAGDVAALQQAGRVKAPGGQGKVLIIGESTNPAGQRRFASQTPGAVAVEAVDLRDFVAFGTSFDIQAADALQKIVEFSQELMTNVGAADLLKRVETIRESRNRKPPTSVEAAALAFEGERTYQRISELMEEIGKQSGVRAYRPAVLSALMRALQVCRGDDGTSLRDAVIRMREQNRLLGRPLPSRAVGSTLLLKGLEAEAVVILAADGLDAQNLYVALTRGSMKIVVCSKSPMLPTV